MDAQIADVAESSQYVITVDGVHAGRAVYQDVEGSRVFVHTEIGDDFAGQGLASALAGAALGDASERGYRIVAVCPFIAHYLESHHEVDDAVDAPTPAILAALGEPPLG